MQWLSCVVLGCALFGSSAALAADQATAGVQVRAGGAISQTQIKYTVSYAVPGTGLPAAPGQPVPPTQVTFSVPAVLFVPSGPGRFPAIVFAHDGQNGVTESMKRRGEDLARQGFVVLAPQYKGDGLGKAVRNETAIQTLMHARGYLNNHPRVKQNLIGLMGTSAGGYLALQTAIKEAGKWNCVVQAGGAIDVPSTKTRIQSRLLLQHGDMDRVVLRKHANYLDATLRKAGTSCELKEYTLLDHNFWFWEDKNYTVEEQAQADWAWDDVLGFLNRSLNSGHKGGHAK